MFHSVKLRFVSHTDHSMSLRNYNTAEVSVIISTSFKEIASITLTVTCEQTESTAKQITQQHQRCIYMEQRFLVVRLIVAD